MTERDSTPATGSSPDPSRGSGAPSGRAGRSRRSLLLFVVCAGVLLAADLAIKAASFRHVAGVPVRVERADVAHPVVIPRHDPRPVIPGVLSLSLTTNHGAVFGLGRGGRWFFIAFSLVAVAVIGTIFARSAPSALVLHLALASVLAGALGNLYDRIRFGVVRDMFWMFPDSKLPFGWTWPDGSAGLYPWIFNLADVCLVLGLIVLMVIMYRHESPETS